MTKLSAADMRKLARLCKLRLTDEEIKRYQNDLSAILEYVAVLQKVDTGDLEPTSQVTGLTNVVLGADCRTSQESSIWPTDSI